MVGAGIACLIGIFLLLQACFSSWRQALVGFLAIPVAAAGGVLAVLVSGGVMSLGSIIGFLAVLGIAARNVVLLIKGYQRIEEQEGQVFGLELVLRGARERLTPTLASAAAIIGALLPIVAFGRIPGLEIVGPTAIVMLGGVVASSLVHAVRRAGAVFAGALAARRASPIWASPTPLHEQCTGEHMAGKRRRGAPDETTRRVVAMATAAIFAAWGSSAFALTLDAEEPAARSRVEPAPAGGAGLRARRDAGAWVDSFAALPRPRRPHFCSRQGTERFNQRCAGR